MANLQNAPKFQPMEKAKTDIISGENLQLLLSSIFLLVGAIFIVPYGNFQEAGTVPKFLIGISIMIIGFIISWGIKSISPTWFWSITILARVILMAMEPGDDIWRYLWEGYIQNLGFSPYNLAPNSLELIPYRTEWWSLINHLDTSAIYPPLTQLGFRALAIIQPSVLIFKSAFVLADLGICWLLTRKFSLPETLIYAWNPLIIYSFAGGGHYDSWFILPLVVAWLIFDDDYWYFSAFLIGISIAIKWISLPILSFVIWQKILDFQGKAEGDRKVKKLDFKIDKYPQHNYHQNPKNYNSLPLNQLQINIIVQRQLQQIKSYQKRLIQNSGKLQQIGLLLLLGLLPMCLTALNFCDPEKCSLIPTNSNFVTQGRSAEFIPYLVSLIWQESTKYNWIYAIPLGLGVGILLWNYPKFVNFTEWYFFLLLTISPIVHAWYFTWLIPLTVATRNLGTKWVSLSAFIYFMLKHRQALGDNNWFLTAMERYWLWLPLIIGFLWSQWKYKKIQNPQI
ncbi:MAG: hypothetical protein AB4080_22145 [Trichodesmium sp.]